ncbi:hypothetical protein UG55_106627 [Frankia sp. EI5c]|uniref:DUF6221 family protein n=1 Tax=Frankia sp. EI5c TaxID=683316 RepID=UPI0007C31432|nr:DUF6221 family protein [Frankia sp. EI5c]OAA20990.1 hypothetical protein UG55_106627 [Frankia sp. EI5c]
MPDLRTRILDRLDHLERTASAVPGASVWNARQVAGRTGVAPPTAEHIARWNPAAVRTLCANAREIVDLHGYDHDCEGDNGPWRVPDGRICATLRPMARMLGIEPIEPDEPDEPDEV